MGDDTVDVLRELSMARTALDDPAGLPEAESDDLDRLMSAAFRPREARDEWVVARIDAAMETLSPSELHRRTLATSLRAFASMLDELRQEVIGCAVDADDSVDASAYRITSDSLLRVLTELGRCITLNDLSWVEP